MFDEDVLTLAHDTVWLARLAAIFTGDLTPDEERIFDAGWQRVNGEMELLAGRLAATEGSTPTWN